MVVGSSRGRNWYLIVYNTICLGLWVAAAWRVAPYLPEAFEQNNSGRAFEAGGRFIKYAMTLAVLEVVHGMIGMSKTRPITAFMQVASRLQLCYLVWDLAAPETTEHIGTVLVMGAWIASELIRYPFYIAQLGKGVPFWLKWIRYSGFIVLYPIGICGEVLCMNRAVHVFKDFVPWPSPMPNRWNFELSLSTLYKILLCLYIPGSVHMYTHMLNQRKKALKDPAAAAAAVAAANKDK